MRINNQHFFKKPMFGRLLWKERVGKCGYLFLLLYLPVRYSPLWAHSFRSLSLSGVPGKGRPFLLSMSNPMPNEAIPLPLPEQGRLTLKTEIKRRCRNDVSTEFHFWLCMLSKCLSCCYEFIPLGLRGTRPRVLIEINGGSRIFSSKDCSRSKL